VSLKNYISFLAFTLCFLHIAESACSQDLHFSQFIHSPLSTNPANTGFIPDGDYRLGANFRDQWSAVMSVPYKTISAYGDVQLMKEKFENGWIGAGGLILRDVAGSGTLTSTKVYGSIAYHQMLGYSSLLSLGFNVGYSNKNINQSNLKFPDQFDGKFFDNKMPTTAVLRTTSTGYMDMQVGMNYAYFPNDKVYMNAGFSTHHLNRGHESFFSITDSASGPDNGVAMRHIGFLNGSWMISDQWIINPNIYYTAQAKSHELVAGMNAQYNLSGDGEYQLLGGLYYRHREAVIPMIGLGVKNYQFAFTYDATVSSLNRYNQTRGAFEFSLTMQGLFDKYNGNRKETLCPSFRN
jgi:type IX secretion system PorP/SprF family membrane protein